MKGNPVHVVVDEGTSNFCCEELTFFRAIVNAAQMDKVCHVVWAYGIFRIFSRFNNGGNHWSIEIDACAWGSQIHSDWTAGKIQ